jgi:hypothetical protein
MYTTFDFEEQALFYTETETVISMRGQSSTIDLTVQYFETVVKDLSDKTAEFEAYTGSYTIDPRELIVRRIRPVKDSVINESGGLQLIISAASIERFIKLAKANYCKSLVVFTRDPIVAESLFMKKFRMCKLINAEYEVRAELKL